MSIQNLVRAPPHQCWKTIICSLSLCVSLFPWSFTHWSFTIIVPMATTQKFLTFSLLLDHHHPTLSFPSFLSKPHNHKLSSKFSPATFNATRALYTHSSTSHKLFTPITVSRPSSSFLQMGPHEACSSREITVKSSVSESGGTSTLSQRVLFSHILLLCLFSPPFQSVFYLLQAKWFNP